jgi:hypothetical protein
MIFLKGSEVVGPKSDEELNEWLASPEGKAAMMFEQTSLDRWGETGRS